MRISHLYNALYTQSGELKPQGIPPAAGAKKSDRVKAHEENDGGGGSGGGGYRRLEADTQFLALMVFAMAQELEEQGVFSAERLIKRMHALDPMDGTMDHRLDVDVLRRQVDPSIDEEG